MNIFFDTVQSEGNQLQVSLSLSLCQLFDWPMIRTRWKRRVKTENRAQVLAPRRFSGFTFSNFEIYITSKTGKSQLRDQRTANEDIRKQHSKMETRVFVGFHCEHRGHTCACGDQNLRTKKKKKSKIKIEISFRRSYVRSRSFRFHLNSNVNFANRGSSERRFLAI